MSSDTICFGYQDGKGQIVVTDVLAVGIHLTPGEIAELSRQLSRWSGYRKKGQAENVLLDATPPA